MKVILKQDVKSLGKKESVVEVSDGYAKNYLFRRGLAVEANSNNVNIMNTKKKAEQNKHASDLDSAKIISEKIENIELIFKGKAGENGKLFGSITNKDVAEQLNKDFKIKIDKKKIALDDPIKTLGKTHADVKVFTGVSAKLKISVVQE